MSSGALEAWKKFLTPFVFESAEQKSELALYACQGAVKKSELAPTVSPSVSQKSELALFRYRSAELRLALVSIR